MYCNVCVFSSENTWEPEKNLKCAELIHAFEERTEQAREGQRKRGAKKSFDDESSSSNRKKIAGVWFCLFAITCTPAMMCKAGTRSGSLV